MTVEEITARAEVDYYRSASPSPRSAVPANGLCGTIVVSQDPFGTLKPITTHLDLLVVLLPHNISIELLRSRQTPVIRGPRSIVQNHSLQHLTALEPTMFPTLEKLLEDDIPDFVLFDEFVKLSRRVDPRGFEVIAKIAFVLWKRGNVQRVV
jgi:hypothetical protein